MNPPEPSAAFVRVVVGIRMPCKRSERLQRQVRFLFEKWTEIISVWPVEQKTKMTSASSVNVTFKAKYFVFGGGKSHDQLTAAREDVLPLNICLESPDDLKVIIAESTEFKAVMAAGGVRKSVHDVEDTIEPLLPSVVGFYMPGASVQRQKHVLNTAANMTTMYALHPQKRTNPSTIYTFAEVRPGKEAVGDMGGQTSPTAATLMADKVEVYEHLKEKHRDQG